MVFVCCYFRRGYLYVHLGGWVSYVYSNSGDRRRVALFEKVFVMIMHVCGAWLLGGLLVRNSSALPYERRRR